MKRALAATLSLFAFTFLAPPTMAGEAIETEVIMRDKAPAFHGKVKAALQDCVSAREVELYRKVSGKPKKLLGTDLANGQGKWKVLEDQFTLKSGLYFAIARKSGPCQKDRSNKVSVD